MAMSLDLAVLKTKAIRGVFTLTFRRLLLKVIDTVGIIYLARLLSQESFGVFGIVSFVVFTFLSFFSDIGFGAALIQKEKVSDTDLRTTFTIQQGLVTLLLIVAWLLAPVLGNFYGLGTSGAWLIRILSLSLFLTSFKTIPSILLERQLRFELLIIPEIIETIAYNAIAVYLASRGYGVWSLVVAVVVRTTLGALALNLVAPWKIGWGLNRQSARELLHFGVPFQLNSVLALLKDNLTPTLIAIWYGPAAVGFVNVAQNISSRPLEISTIVSRITFPAYSRIQGDKERLKRWIEKSVHLMNAVYFPAIIGLMATAKPILQYLYADRSDKWLPAYPTLMWFLLAAVPVVITTTYTNAIFATGYPKRVLWLMVLYTAMTWGIGIPLIRILGFSGIAITVAVITYLTLPIVLRMLNRIVRVDTWSVTWRPLTAALLMGGAVYLFRLAFVTDIWSLALAILTGILVYGSLLYLFDGRRLRAEFSDLFASLFARG